MGRIYRALRLNNANNVRDVVAFVDSGSDKTVISERIANKLELQVNGSERIQVANREIIDMKLAKVRVISTKDNIDCIMRVGVTDIPFEFEPDENIDMIMGLDFLQKNNVRLNFEKPDMALV